MRYRIAIGILVYIIICTVGGANGTTKDMLYITALPNKVVVVDGETDQIVSELIISGIPHQILPSPDGQRLYVLTDGRRTIESFDLNKKQKVDSITFSKDTLRVHIYGFSFNDDGSKLYFHALPSRWGLDELIAEDPYIGIYDLSTKAVKKTIPVPRGVGAIIPIIGDENIYAFGRDIYIINLKKGAIIDTIGLANPTTPGETPFNSLTFGPNYHRGGLATLSYYTHDPITNSLKFGLLFLDTSKIDVHKMELGPPIAVFSVVLSPDKRYAYGVFNQLTVIDLKAKRVKKIVPLSNTHYSVDLSTDGKKIYLSGASPDVTIIDPQSLKVLKTIPLPGNSFELKIIPTETD